MHSHYSSFFTIVGCLYYLIELTAWKICVMSESKPKQRVEKPQVTRSRLGTMFVKRISVLMKALSHKSALLILNVSIVS